MVSLYPDGYLDVIRFRLSQGTVESYFHENMIHPESDIDRDINSWNHPRRMEIESVYVSLLKAYNIKRQSPQGWYLYASLLDHSSIYKH